MHTAILEHLVLISGSFAVWSLFSGILTRFLRQILADRFEARLLLVREKVDLDAILTCILPLLL